MSTHEQRKIAESASAMLHASVPFLASLDADRIAKILEVESMWTHPKSEYRKAAERILEACKAVAASAPAEKG